MRKIIYSRPDGGLSVVHPIINSVGEAEGFTEAQAEQRAWDKLPKDAFNPQFVEADVIPANRTFREAWVHGGDVVTVDIAKAKGICKYKLKDPALDAAIDAAQTVEELKAVMPDALKG